MTKLKFRTVRDTFPEWTSGQASAYLAGATAYERDEVAERWDAASEWDDDISHYYRGVADAMGEDAAGEDWFGLISDWRIRHCWWDGEQHDPADSEE